MTKLSATDSWSRYAALAAPQQEAVDAELANYLAALGSDPVIHYRTCCILAHRAADD